MVPQCAGGLVSRPEPVCASRWLCVFLCVGDDHIIVMWLDVFSVVWLIDGSPLPPSLPPSSPSPVTSCRSPLLQASFFILPLPSLLPLLSLILSRYVVAPVILSFLGHVGHLDENSPEKCPVSDLACQSVVGCVVTGTPKNILYCSHCRSHVHVTCKPLQWWIPRVYTTVTDKPLIIATSTDTR